LGFLGVVPETELFPESIGSCSYCCVEEEGTCTLVFDAIEEANMGEEEVGLQEQGGGDGAFQQRVYGEIYGMFGETRDVDTARMNT
jgi:hypothetical protein